MTHTHSTAPASKSRGGFTLVELMLAMTLMVVVMTAIVSMFRSQSRSFRKSGALTDLHQNARFAMSTLDRVLRAGGSGTARNQPMFVYGDNNTLTFNANYASDQTSDNALYVNPNLPASAIDAANTAAPFTIPGTAIVYPPVNYTWGGGGPSRAETITFYFTADVNSPNPNAFMLMQQVNNTPPEMVARNLLAYPGRPFFEYWYDNLVPPSDTVPTQIVAAQLPIYHAAAQHGSPADVAPSTLADQIRSVRINIRGWNGVSGADSVSRIFSTRIRMPNNGLGQLSTCGDVPVPAGALTATKPGPPNQVRLQWAASADEAGGEKDVLSYNVYFRLVGAPDWQTVRTQAAGSANYDITQTFPVPAGNYQFAVAAQDCTPQESAQSVSINVALP